MIQAYHVPLGSFVCSGHIMWPWVTLYAPKSTLSSSLCSGHNKSPWVTLYVFGTPCPLGLLCKSQWLHVHSGLYSVCYGYSMSSWIILYTLDTPWPSGYFVCSERVMASWVTLNALDMYRVTPFVTPDSVFARFTMLEALSKVQAPFYLHLWAVNSISQNQEFSFHETFILHVASHLHSYWTLSINCFNMAMTKHGSRYLLGEEFILDHGFSLLCWGGTAAGRTQGSSSVWWSLLTSW